MSKSMAIEGVMKIFLMVAVIIVGMSFLFKAFGIDIFGWLNEKLSGFSIPESGKALHVRIDPGENEIFEFHLMKSGEAKKHLSENERGFGVQHPDLYFFSGDSLPGDKCILYVTNEDDRAPDEAYVYYIAAGGVIDKNTIFLFDLRTSQNKLISVGCIAGVPEVGKKCEDNVCTLVDPVNRSVIRNDRSCSGPAHHIDCASKVNAFNEVLRGKMCLTKEDNDVVKYKFTQDTTHAMKKDCEDAVNGYSSKCDLLLTNKGDADKQPYLVKYGLICNSGSWHTCTPNKQVPDQAGKSCHCSGENICEWS